MTVTDIDPAPSAQAGAPVLYLERAEVLFRAVSNAMLFAAPASSDVPALSVVRFERDKDGKLTILALDRYRLFMQTVEHRAGSEAGEFAFSLGLDDAKQLATVLKGAGSMGSAMLVVEAERLRVQAGAAEITLRPLIDYSFPDYRKLMPKEDATVGVDAIAFNPRFLADLGKLKHDRAAAGLPAHFTFFGSGKPALIRFTDGLTLLHMPVPLGPAQPQPAKAA